MTEDEMIDTMILYLNWDNDPIGRYHALRTLRLLRGEPVPTFDDFNALVRRDSDK